MLMRWALWSCLFAFFIVLSPISAPAKPGDSSPRERNTGLIDQLRGILGNDGDNPDAASGEADDKDQDKNEYEPLESLDVFIVNAATGHFQVSVSYDKPPPDSAKGLTLWIRSSSSKTKILLTPSADGKSFESGLLRIVDASLRGDPRFADGRPMRRRLDRFYPRSAQTAAKLFAGAWLVAHTGKDGEKSMGVGQIAINGKSARLFLDTPEGGQKYVSDDLLAVPDSSGGRHTLEIRFRPVDENPVEGPELPPSTAIYVSASVATIDIETPYQNYSKNLPVWRGDGPDAIKVSLIVDNANEMHGAWSREETGGALSGGGQQTWNKGADIERIVVLETQRPQPRKGRSFKSFVNNENAKYGDYSPGRPILDYDRVTDYPYIDGGQGDKTSRLIMVVGRGLPVRAADARVIRSFVGGMSYSLVALPGERDDLFKRGWRKVRAERDREQEAALESGNSVIRQIRAGDEETAPSKDAVATDAIILRAAFTEAAAGPGFKILTVNRAIGGWQLDYANANGYLRFAKFVEQVGSADNIRDDDPSDNFDSSFSEGNTDIPWREGVTGRNGSYETVHTPFVGDDLFIVLDEQIPIGREKLDFDLYLNGKPVARLAARLHHSQADGQGGAGQYVTQPIKLRLPLSPLSPLPDPNSPSALSGADDPLGIFSLGETRAEPLELVVQRGDRLSAVLVDPTAVHAFPPRLDAEIAQNPGDLGMVWKQALKTAAACYKPATTIDFDAITSEQAKVYSELIAWDNKLNFLNLTNISGALYQHFVQGKPLLDFNEIGVSKGDHAAALLMRDEFLKVLPPEIKKFSKMVEDDEALWKFYWTHRSDDVPFWKIAKVTGPIEMESELAAAAADFTETLSNVTGEKAIRALTDYLYEKFGFDTDENAERGDWIIGDLVREVTTNPAKFGLVSARHGHLLAFRKTREALVQYLNSANFAYAHAMETLDCSLDDLLLIGAQDADGLVARILPRLVERTDDSSGWQPDRLAQGYVKSLKTKGAAIRALKEYALLDKGFQAGVLIIASAGTASFLTAGGFVVAAEGLMLAADIADILLYSPEVVESYIDGYGNRRLNFAEGASLVMTEGAYEDALAVHTEWWGAALSTLAPAGGAGMGVRSVRNARAVLRGAEIMKTLGHGALTRKVLLGLSDPDRLALAGRLGDLQSRIGTGGNTLFRRNRAWWNNFGRVLDEAELKEFNKIAKFLREEGVEIADAVGFIKQPIFLDEAVDSVAAARNAERATVNASAARVNALDSAAADAGARAARSNAAADLEQAARASAAAETRAARDSVEVARAQTAAIAAREAEQSAEATARAARRAEESAGETVNISPAEATRNARKATQSAAREAEELRRTEDVARAARAAEVDAARSADTAREAERAAREAAETEARAAAEAATAEGRAARETLEAETKAAGEAVQARRAEDAARAARGAEVDALKQAENARIAREAAQDAAKAADEATAARRAKEKAARDAAAKPETTTGVPIRPGDEMSEAERILRIAEDARAANLAAEAEAKAADELTKTRRVEETKRVARRAEEKAAARASASADARATTQAAEARRAAAADNATRQAGRSNAARRAVEPRAGAARQAAQAETRQLADATQAGSDAVDQAARARRAEAAARAAREAEADAIARALREAEPDVARRAELDTQAQTARQTRATAAREAAEAKARAARQIRQSAETFLDTIMETAASSRGAANQARRAGSEASARMAAARRAVDKAGPKARAALQRAVEKASVADQAGKFALDAKVTHLHHLPTGRVVLNKGQLTIDLGPHIGRGRTTSAFGSGAGKDKTLRFLRRGFKPADFAYDELGYEILDELEAGADGIYTMSRQSKPVLITHVDDPRYNDLIGSYVSVARRVDGQAQKQIAAQGGVMTKGQLLALKRVIAYFNRRGVVWADNHLGNFKFVLVDAERDIWRLDIFDYGGFYKMDGVTDADKFLNARALQRASNPADSDWVKNYQAARQTGNKAWQKILEKDYGDIFEEAMGKVDWDAFATNPHGLIVTSIDRSPTMRPNYRLLENLNPADADKLYTRHTGKAPAAKIPVDPKKMDGLKPLPDHTLDAIDKRWTEEVLEANANARKGDGAKGGGSSGGAGEGGSSSGGGGKGGSSSGGGGKGGSSSGGAALEGVTTQVLPFRKDFRPLDESTPTPRPKTVRIRTERLDMRDLTALGYSTERVDMGDLDSLIRRLDAEKLDEFRRAETALITNSELRAMEEAAKDAQDKRLGEFLKQQNTYRGFDELERYVESGQLDELTFRHGADSVTERRRVGEFIADGSFNEVFHDGQDAKRVIRASKYTEGHAIFRMEKQGRIGAESAAQARPRDLIVPTLYERFSNIRSSDPRLAGKTIEYVEYVPERSAKDLFAANGSQPNPWQADAYMRGVRALNDQGYILADAHPGNYTFRSRPGSDELTMVLTDPGSVIRAKGGLPANARAAQVLIDNPPPELLSQWDIYGRNPVFRWQGKKGILMKEGLEDLIDLEILGVGHGDFVPMSPQGAEFFPEIRELMNLSPEDAARRLDEMKRNFRDADRERIPLDKLPDRGDAVTPLRPDRSGIAPAILEPFALAA